MVCWTDQEHSLVWDGTLSPNEFEMAAMSLIDKWASCCSTSELWKWEACPKFPYGASHDVKGFLSIDYVKIQGSKKQGLPLSYKKKCESDITQCALDSLQNIYTGNGRGVEADAGEHDSATLDHNLDEEVHLYTYHIVYNNSYRVPMLLFTGCHPDGKTLESDDIVNDLPSYSHKILEESKWTFLTQEEHPYLNEPWHCLHPCGTSEWMRLLLSSNLSPESDSSTENCLDIVEVALSEANLDNKDCRNESLPERNVEMKDDSFIYKQTRKKASMKDIFHLYLISWLSVVCQVVGLKVPIDILG